MPKKVIVLGENNEPTGLIKFTFENGTEQELNVFSLPENIQKRLTVHGASQKIGDSYAGAKGESDPVAFAAQAVAETIKQLVDGLWRVTSPGGPRVTDLATVLAKVQGITVEQAVELIAELDEEQTKQLRNKPKIKAGLLALTAARAAEKAAKAAAEAANAAD